VRIADSGGSPAAGFWIALFCWGRGLASYKACKADGFKSLWEQGGFGADECMVFINEGDGFRLLQCAAEVCVFGIGLSEVWD
jgi:hypothetical protein